MSEMDPSLREYVDAYLEETSTSPDQVEVALREVTTKLGPAPATPAESAGLGIAAKAGLALALVAGTALLWPRPDPPASVSSPGPAVAEADAPDEPDEPDVPIQSSPGSVQPPDDAVNPEIVPEPAAAEPAPPPKQTRRPVQKEKLAPVAVDSLAAELELMRSARTALRAGDPRRALSLVREHGRRYPDSSFAEERSSTEVMALCALGDKKSARTKAAEFRQRFPGSAFEAGLVEACEE